MNSSWWGLVVAAWFLLCAPCAEGARVTGEAGTTSTAPAVTAPAPVAATGETVQIPEPPPPPAQTETEAPLQEPVSPPPPQPPEAEDRDTESPLVTIDFDNVDLPVFIKFISELTGKNFVIDRAVSGKVTILSPTRISVDQAYKVFESVLEVQGFAAVPAGDIIKILPAVEARARSVETRLRQEADDPDDRVVTQLIPLKFANPEELKKLFTPFISKSSVMMAYIPSRTLIVTDVLSNVDRLLRITEAIDVEGVGEEILVIPLQYAFAGKLAQSLGTVFQSRMRRGQPPGQEEADVRIVADERTNTLVILASEDTTRKIRQLVDLLDREPLRGEGDIRVVYLQHANAEELTKVLTSLPVGASAAASEQGKQPILSKDTRIVADKATNSLVITANKDDYRVLEEVIQKLDIPRLMVYLEALIMEVNVDKDFSLGVEWEGVKEVSYDGKTGGIFGGSSGGSDYKNIAGILSDRPSLPRGFSLGVIGEMIEIGGIKFPNLAAVVNAYRQDSDVHILSTPQILTTDNEEAEITVGKNVPYVTRQETSQALIDYSSYEYKDVGVTLRVTPQISQNRLVRLKIFQEVTRLIDTDGLKDGRPTTYKRMAETTVIVQDANTVVIGGLIGDDTTHVDYQVPCLANIPGIGWLFRGTSRKREQTNLFVFLTPRIVQSPAEADVLYRDKKDQIERVKEGVIKMYRRGEGVEK